MATKWLRQADARTPISPAADAIIALAFADEQSVVQIRFATTELALLLAHLGTDVEPVAATAERVLAEPLPGVLTDGSQYTFLGTGWTVGLASEAALKLRESARLWAESYPAMEYRHGPIAVTGPGSLVWMLGPTRDWQHRCPYGAAPPLDPTAPLPPWCRDNNLGEATVLCVDVGPRHQGGNGGPRRPVNSH